MLIESFYNVLLKNDINYFCGVPDSLLGAFCDYLYQKYGTKYNNIICPNEGTCVALATGHYLATSKVPCVYMQNSGIGNAANPIISLTNSKVYSIPMLLVIGYRGEPGIKDEPQHIFQGEITLELLSILDIKYMILDEKTTEQELEKHFLEFNDLFAQGKSVAIVVKKGALKNKEAAVYQNKYTLSRELAIKTILDTFSDDIFVSTTGKISRELYEHRINEFGETKKDFLTVGSMGHCSAIALGIALQKTNSQVICLDGDGAFLMHMGALALIGNKNPDNFIHIVLNNEAHESVGGTPTCADKLNIGNIALACGYAHYFVADSFDSLTTVLSHVKVLKALTLIEVKVSLSSRENLIRPHTTPMQNKMTFMKLLE